MQSRTLIIGSAERRSSFLDFFEGAAYLEISSHQASKDLDFSTLYQAEALLITSALSVEALQDSGFVFKKAPAFYCVGDMTARAVSRAGGSISFTGEGSGEALAKALASTHLPTSFVHICGSSSGQAWYQYIQEKGTYITPFVCYEAQYKQNLNPHDLQLFKTVDRVMVLSDEGLKHTQVLCKKFGVDVSSYTLICISESVAALAKGWKKVLFARTPTKSDLLAQLKSLDGASSS